MIQMNLLQNRFTDIESKLTVTKGERVRGRLNMEFGINRSTSYKINKKALLYSTGNYIQCLVIAYNGKEL